MEIQDIDKFLVGVNEFALSGVPSQHTQHTQPETQTLSQAVADRKKPMGLRQGPSVELSGAAFVLSAIATYTEGYYSAQTIRDLNQLCEDTRGFQRVCAKTGRRFSQVAWQDVLAMLVAGNSRATVEYWLSSELAHKVAPEWLHTGPQQLDKLADSDPVGYFVFQLGLGCRGNDSFAERRKWAVLYDKLNKQATKETLYRVNENMRRVLSWVSHQNLQKRGGLHLVGLVVNYLDGNPVDWHADLLLNRIDTQLHKALKQVVKWCQKQRIIGEQFCEADIYNLREKMEGYTQLHLQGKKDYAILNKQALTDFVDSLGVDLFREDLKARSKQTVTTQQVKQVKLSVGTFEKKGPVKLSIGGGS